MPQSRIGMVHFFVASATLVCVLTKQAAVMKIPACSEMTNGRFSISLSLSIPLVSLRVVNPSNPCIGANPWFRHCLPSLQKIVLSLSRVND